MKRSKRSLRGNRSIALRNLMAVVALLCTAALGAPRIAHGDASQPAAAPPAPSPAALSPASSTAYSLLNDRPAAISANPGASNILVGTGLLGRLIGFTPESGITIGGMWIGDADYLFTGGQKPRTWSFNSLFIPNLYMDLDKILGLPGASIDAAMLQFNGENANGEAGSIQGYDGLVVVPPFVRTELYKLWWRQKFFEDKLIFIVGKNVPTIQFNNVSRPVDVSDPAQEIAAVTSLIYAPIFVNPTMIGVAPGYYNSAYGITANWAPTKNFYISYGFYDGSLASGIQTGLKEGPQFNGHYFTIGEAGYCWLLGPEQLPGKVAMGGWVQTGKLYGPGVQQEGAQGAYALGSQRIWYRNPGVNNSGVSAFYQFGFNTSNTMLINRFFGMGATGFGLIPGRLSDSMGMGLAWSWLNRRYDFRSNEAMLQWYYQMHLVGTSFLQPVISYIPNPGASTQIQGAVTATAQLIVLF